MIKLQSNSGIYCIISSLNNKKYIGSSSNLSKRIREHFRLLKNNEHISKYMQHSYNKYGLDSFSVKILEYVSVESLIIKEQEYIDNLLPEFNSSKVAGSCLGYKFGKQSYKTKLLKRKVNKKKIKVLQISKKGEIIKEWESTRDAQRRTKIQSIHISEVCRNIRKSAGGFIWKYI